MGVVGVELVLLFDPFLELGPMSGPDAGLTGGVVWGSQQAKVQRFLMILVLGVGERSLQ